MGSARGGLGWVGWRSRWNREGEPGWVEMRVKTGWRENQSDLGSLGGGTEVRLEERLSLDRERQGSREIFWGLLWQPGQIGSTAHGPKAFCTCCQVYTDDPNWPLEGAAFLA